MQGPIESTPMSLIREQFEVSAHFELPRGARLQWSRHQTHPRMFHCTGRVSRWQPQLHPHQHQRPALTVQSLIPDHSLCCQACAGQLLRAAERRAGGAAMPAGEPLRRPGRPPRPPHQRVLRRRRVRHTLRRRLLQVGFDFRMCRGRGGLIHNCLPPTAAKSMPTSGRLRSRQASGALSDINSELVMASSNVTLMCLLAAAPTLRWRG